MSQRREYRKLKTAIGKMFGTLNRFAKHLHPDTDQVYVYDVLHGNRDFPIGEQQAWANALTGGLHTDPLWTQLTDETSDLPEMYRFASGYLDRSAKPLTRLKEVIKRKFKTQRSFAEHIQEDPIRVSKVLTGKDRLSENRRRLWARGLEFEADDVAFDRLFIPENDAKGDPPDTIYCRSSALLYRINEIHETIQQFAYQVGEAPCDVVGVISGKQGLSGLRKEIWCNVLLYPTKSPEFDDLFSEPAPIGENHEIQTVETAR